MGVFLEELSIVQQTDKGGSPIPLKNRKAMRQKDPVLTFLLLFVSRQKVKEIKKIKFLYPSPKGSEFDFSSELRYKTN